MGLASLNDRAAVISAVQEFDEVGRTNFLRKYGFAPARSYFLVLYGRFYDSKAIVAAAHGYQFPQQGPLASIDFSGGERTVRAKLEALGFSVASTDGTPIAPTTWAEITSLAHGHGGRGWELGTCLWSPSASRDGANRYEVMRLPQEGDRVVHLVSGVSEYAPRQRVLFGESIVDRSVETRLDPPPSPGEWRDAPSYFRVELRAFSEYSQKLAMDEIEAGLTDIILSDLLRRPRYYPYAPYRDTFRGAQGIYLTRLSSSLALALNEIVGVAAQGRVGSPKTLAEEFAEGQRGRRESSFFNRNPALRTAAIARHGVVCKACGFDFERVYGELGAGFVEMHHINPLAERSDGVLGQVQMTRVEDVVPVCANCHRVIHRRRPALTVEEVRTVYEARRKT